MATLNPTLHITTLIGSSMGCDCCLSGNVLSWRLADPHGDFDVNSAYGDALPGSSLGWVCSRLALLRTAYAREL